MTTRTECQDDPRQPTGLASQCERLIEMWPIDRPKPHPDNPRVHSQDHVGLIAKSIETFQALRPIVVDEQDTILAGHGVWWAHKRLGRPAIAVVVVKHLTEELKRAFLIADNQIGLNSDWDDPKLAQLILALEKELVDVSVLGFDPSELDRLLADMPAEAFADDDQLPAPTSYLVSQPGDVWVLGKHRLLCGDSTQRESYRTLLGEQSADMVFCDAPYNCNYRQKRRRRQDADPIANDNLGENFEQFLSAVCVEILRVCRGAVYLCMSSAELHTLFKAFTSAGGHWSTFVMWSKDRFTLGRSEYQRQYEPILYGWKEGGRHFWNGSRNQGDVWYVRKPKANRLHPTMKPVELIERAIRNSSQRGDLVLDPFGGSGSTLIACEKTSRRAALIELEPKYVDATVRRWEAYTQQQAALEGSGQSFAVVAGEQGKQAA